MDGLGRLNSRFSFANGLGKDAWAIYRPIALGPDVRSYFPPGDLRLPRAFFVLRFGCGTLTELGSLGILPTPSGRGYRLPKRRSGRSSAWLERLLWEQEVARSNRVAPTYGITLYFLLIVPQFRSSAVPTVPHSNLCPPPLDASFAGRCFV